MFARPEWQLDTLLHLESGFLLPNVLQPASGQDLFALEGNLQRHTKGEVRFPNYLPGKWVGGLMSKGRSGLGSLTRPYVAPA